MIWILIYISMGVVGLYAAYGLFIFLGFYLIPSGKKKNEDFKFISVIIPFRNEEKNLSRLLESLQNLSYPSDKYEIIFINDHSTDKGVWIIENSPVPSLLIHNKESGKKNAIELGVSQATGEWIACTDADCILPPTWLKSINQSDGEMILGPVELNTKGTGILALQEIEWAALQAISASMCFWKKPVMNNGANLAYRKNEYDSNALKKQTASGDDIFMLEHFRNKKLKVRFNWLTGALVKTEASKMFSELINQRVRWASKSKYYTRKENIVLGLLIASVNIVVMIALLNIVLWNPTSIFFSMVLLTKIMADITFTLPYFILTQKPYLVLWVPFFALIYPFYYVIVLARSIQGKYSWKERNYHA